MRVRVEQFGGLVAVDDSIVAVNRAAMRALGIRSSPLWSGPARGIRLRAPIEAQLVLTRRCIAACDYCSVDAHARGADFDVASATRTIDDLARRGVFTLAFGGGEPLLHPHVFELARHARAHKLWTTLTTAGLNLVDDDVARQCVDAFDAVHVSLHPNGTRALEALVRAHHPRLGVNVLLEHGKLDVLVDAAHVARTSRCVLQLLRIKPAGRAHPNFMQRDLTADDERFIVDEVKKLVAGGLQVRVDCALAPLFDAPAPSTSLPHATVAIFPEGEAECVVEGNPPLVGIRSRSDPRRSTA